MSDILNVATSFARTVDPATPQSLPPVADAPDNSDLQDFAKVVYFSPVAQLDVDTSQVLYRFRDSSTGEVTRQFPSERQLAAYQSGLSLSPDELARYFVGQSEDAAAAGSAAAQQNAEAIANIQSGLQTAPDTEAQSVNSVTGETVSNTTTASIQTVNSPAGSPNTAPEPNIALTFAEPTVQNPQSPPPAPEVVQFVSGAPRNGVSDVTSTGTDANAVGEGEVRTLASASV